MEHYETMGGYKPYSYDIWVEDGQNFYTIATIDGNNSFYTLDDENNEVIPGALYYASANLPWNCDLQKQSGCCFSSNQNWL